MDDFLDAPFPAFRTEAPVHIPIMDTPIFPEDGRFRELVEPLLRVFEPVLRNPGEYLMPRRTPFVELPDSWEVFSGNNYIGVRQHLQEELDAPEQVEDMEDEEETEDIAETSSQSVDAISSAPQTVTKRSDLTIDDQMLEAFGSPPFSVPSFGFQSSSATPDASLTVFGPTLEPGTNSEVLNRTADQVNGLDA